MLEIIRSKFLIFNFKYFGNQNYKNFREVKIQLKLIKNIN